MSRNNFIKAGAINSEIAFKTADNYLRMAKNAIEELNESIKPEEKEQDKKDSSGPIYSAISSFAFSLEIHFKTIIYMLERRIITGHNLKNIWDELPIAVKDWLTGYFDVNHDDTGWNVIFKWGPLSEKKSGVFQTPEISASGMIEGHKDAFVMGRYGYEIPEAQNVQYIFHNISGLQLLSLLTRYLAHHIEEAISKDKKAKKEERENGSSSNYIPFPCGRIIILSLDDLV